MSAALCRRHVRHDRRPAEGALRPGDRPGQDSICWKPGWHRSCKREQLRRPERAGRTAARPRAEPLAREVVEAMTTNESFFFRDDKPFAAFPHPGAAAPARRPPARRARCASGRPRHHRAGGLFAGHDPDRDARRCSATARVEIIGTDISREPLARARDGLYTQFEVQRGLPMQMLVKHFQQGGPQLADRRRDPRAWRSSANGTCWPTCARSASSTSCSAAMC